MNNRAQNIRVFNKINIMVQHICVTHSRKKMVLITILASALCVNNVYTVYQFILYDV